MSAPVRRVVAVSRQRQDNDGLTKLVNRMVEAAIDLQVVPTAEDAAEVLLSHPPDPGVALLVDANLAARAGGDPRMMRGVVRDLQTLRELVPHATPLAFAARPPARIVIDAQRAGAFDFVDMDSTEDDLGAALARSAGETSLRILRRERLAGLRELVEEFLRTLVKTERRTLDLEQRLTELAGPVEGSEHDAVKLPSVLVVDDDEQVLDVLVVELARRGLRAEEASTGMEALAEVKKALAEQDPFDLVLIDKNLPDTDGVRLISRIRELSAIPSFMVMTGFASAESAIDAADLGVVGYIIKPFDDIEALCRRIEDVTEKSRVTRREQRYLDRIKRRHAQFLLRYRELAAELDELGS
jgi:DNA-binding NtrC family response regulator